MHTLDGVFPNNEKYFPGLDKNDYIEALNPGIGKLYYSILEKFPTDQTAFILIFLKFKMKCINTVMASLYKETHRHTHHLSDKKGQPLELIVVDSHFKRIEAFIEEIKPLLADYDEGITAKFEEIMKSAISELIAAHNKKVGPTSRIRQAVSSAINSTK